VRNGNDDESGGGGGMVCTLQKQVVVGVVAHMITRHTRKKRRLSGPSFIIMCLANGCGRSNSAKSEWAVREARALTRDKPRTLPPGQLLYCTPAVLGMYLFRSGTHSLPPAPPI
jgi:hypothetical protein